MAFRLPRPIQGLIYPAVAGGSFNAFWVSLQAGVPPGLALFGLSVVSLTVIAQRGRLRAGR